MSSFKSVLRGAKIAPRKARLVIDLVRGKLAFDAIETLELMNKKAAPLITKLIKSALAAADEKATVDKDRLVVKEAFVDGGEFFVRYIPRAQGRAAPVRKRTSHITIKLEEI